MRRRPPRQEFYTPALKSESKRATWGRFRVWKPREGLSLLSKIKIALRSNDVETAKDLITPLLRRRMMSLPDLGNMMIEMFGKNGCTYEARLVFDGLNERRNPSTWYFIIQAYTISGSIDEASRLYEQMPKHSSALLSVAHNLVLGRYVEEGRISEAKSFFDRITPPSTASWGILFTGYVEHGHLQAAKSLLEEARPKLESIPWVIMIGAYAQNGYLQEAKETLDQMPEKTPIAYSVLVIAFARFGYMEQAHKLFREAPAVDADTWNVMITAYAQRGYHEQAMGLLRRSHDRLNQVTCIALMYSFARQGKLGAVETIYSSMQVTTGVVRNGLLTAYAMNRQLAKAYEVFRTTEDRSMVSWTNMIYGYLLAGSVDKARSLLDRMPRKTLVAANALSTVYAQQGHMKQVKDLYRRRRNALSTSVMILGFAKLKRRCSAFAVMNLEGIQPDEFTFTCLIAACGHLGQWKDAKKHLASMLADFGIAPSFEHYFCTIEALAYNGKLDEAEELSGVMPFVPDVSTAATLFSASKMRGDSRRMRRLRMLVRMKQRTSFDHLKGGPLVTPDVLLDSILSVSYMQDELVIRKRFQSCVRYLNYLSIPTEAQGPRPVITVTPFA